MRRISFVILVLCLLGLAMFSNRAYAFPTVPPTISTNYCVGDTGSYYFLLDDPHMWTDYGNGYLQPTRIENDGFYPYGHFYVYDGVNNQWVSSDWTGPVVKSTNEPFHKNAFCTGPVPYSPRFGQSSNYHQKYPDLPTGYLYGYVFNFPTFPEVPPNVSSDYCMGFTGSYYFLMDDTHHWTDSDNGSLQPTRMENGELSPNGHFYIYDEPSDRWCAVPWSAPVVQTGIPFYLNARCTEDVPYSNVSGSSTNYHENYSDLPTGDLSGYVFDFDPPPGPPSADFPAVPTSISTSYCMGYTGIYFFLMDDTQMWTDYGNGNLQPTRLENDGFYPYGHFYVYDWVSNQWVSSDWTAPVVKLNEPFYNNARCTGDVPYSTRFGSSTNYHLNYPDLPTGDLVGYMFEF